jgi:hypothetical protein
VTGNWPPFCIDHANGKRSDNRFENLREATKSQNNCNRDKRSDNITGFKGVHWEKARKKWRASICIGGKQECIGRYETKEQAAAAYDERARAIHGEFAKTNSETQRWGALETLATTKAGPSRGRSGDAADPLQLRNTNRRPEGCLSVHGEQKSRIRDTEQPRIAASVSPRIEKLIDEEAERLGISKSEVVRRALDAWGELRNAR